MKTVLCFTADITQTRQLFFDSREFDINLVVNNRNFKAIFQFDVDRAQRRQIEYFGRAGEDVFQSQKSTLSGIGFSDLATLWNQVLE